MNASPAGRAFSLTLPSSLNPIQVRKDKRRVIFKRAEQYVKEYRDQEREEIRLRRLAKSTGDFYVPSQPKVVFVVRLRGICNIVSARHYRAQQQASSDKQYPAP